MSYFFIRKANLIAYFCLSLPLCALRVMNDALCILTQLRVPCCEVRQAILHLAAIPFGIFRMLSLLAITSVDSS